MERMEMEGTRRLLPCQKEVLGSPEISRLRTLLVREPALSLRTSGEGTSEVNGGLPKRRTTASPEVVCFVFFLFLGGGGDFCVFSLLLCLSVPLLLFFCWGGDFVWCCCVLIYLFNSI